MPEVGTTAGLSVTMFLNEPFHTQVKSFRWRSSVCYFDSPCLVWISLSRFSKRRVSFQCWLFFVVRTCTLFKYDVVVTLIELLESRPCLWDKTADCFKDKIEKQTAWREVYVFLEEEFLDKDKKEQHNTVLSHDLPENKKNCMYAHAEVIIKFGVVISELFEKSVKTPSIYLTVKSGRTQYSLVLFLYRRLRYIRPRR